MVYSDWGVNMERFPLVWTSELILIGLFSSWYVTQDVQSVTCWWNTCWLSVITGRWRNHFGFTCRERNDFLGVDLMREQFPSWWFLSIFSVYSNVTMSPAPALRKQACIVLCLSLSLLGWHSPSCHLLVPGDRKSWQSRGVYGHW